VPVIDPQTPPLAASTLSTIRYEPEPSPLVWLPVIVMVETSEVWPTLPATWLVVKDVLVSFLATTAEYNVVEGVTEILRSITIFELAFKFSMDG
jgi:hypothetical protein